MLVKVEMVVVPYTLLVCRKDCLCCVHINHNYTTPLSKLKAYFFRNILKWLYTETSKMDVALAWISPIVITISFLFHFIYFYYQQVICGNLRTSENYFDKTLMRHSIPLSSSIMTQMLPHLYHAGVCVTAENHFNTYITWHISIKSVSWSPRRRHSLKHSVKTAPPTLNTLPFTGLNASINQPNTLHKSLQHIYTATMSFQLKQPFTLLMTRCVPLALKVGSVLKGLIILMLCKGIP